MSMCRNLIAQVIILPPAVGVLFKATEMASHAYIIYSLPTTMHAHVSYSHCCHLKGHGHDISIQIFLLIPLINL